MTPGNIDTLLTVFGILSFTGLSLVGLKIILGASIRRRELAAAPDPSQLAEIVESLRADTAALREQVTGEVSELHERLDFAERMLTRGKRESEAPGGTAAQ
jgi:hypothetical protein